MSEAQATAIGPNPTDNNGICLLSLDGGGVRGLSALYILKGVMDQLNIERRRTGRAAAKPCEIFDLIGGTSTGGLISIMLGRLEMSVDECIDAYTGLIEKIFGTKVHRYPLSTGGKVQSRFDSSKLREAIEDVLARRGVPSSALLDDGVERGCKVFVCAVSKSTTGVSHLRSYASPTQLVTTPPTILEAALATSAATGVFDPVKIGAREYVDGALGANNPAYNVEKEATDIWCPESGDLKPLVKCFISIGTDNPGKKAVEDRFDRLVRKTLIPIATETEATALRFNSSWRAQYDRGQYFRFNVEQGLQNVGVVEHEKRGQIEAATAEYFGEQPQISRMRICINNLKNKHNSASPTLAVTYITWKQRSEGLDVSLHEAAEIGDVRAMYSALKRIRVNAKDRDGRTALHLSSLNGRVVFCEDIIREGAAISVFDNNGKTPLDHAVNGCHTSVVKLLLSGGAKASSFDRCPPLAIDHTGPQDLIRNMLIEGVSLDALGKILLRFVESERAKLESVVFLIKGNAHLNVTDAKGWTSVIHAAHNGRLDIVEALCATGRVVIDRQGNRGRTALIWAAIKGHVEVVRLLVRQNPKPDLEIKDTSDRRATAFYYALLNARGDPASSPHMAIADILYHAGAEVYTDDGERRRSLHWFSRNGKHMVVDWYINKRLDLNNKNLKGHTPLMVCCLSFSPKDPGEVCRVMKRLLSNGADSEIRMHVDLGGFTALSIAAMHNCIAEAQVLIEARANVNAMGVCGWTPLAEACERGFPEFASLLVDNGAYLDTRNDRGNTPLHQACANGRGRCVELLLGHGAKPSPRNDDLQTPLHFAARTVRSDIVESLLKRQASVNAQDGKGYTPLSYVAMDELHFQHRLPCGELLLEHGADVSLGNKDGWTPLDEAAFREHLLLIKAFLEKGANANLQIERGEFQGETPLFRAAEAGRLKACRVLIEERHADVGLSNAKGERAIDVTRDPQTQSYLHSIGQEARALSK